MQINRMDYGSVTVLSFEEDEHLNEPETLQEAMKAAIAEGRSDFLIDLENVVYVSSSVLGFLITTFRQMQKTGGNLKLLHVQPCVSNVFRITRLDRILEIFNDLETALASY